MGFSHGQGPDVDEGTRGLLYSICERTLKRSEWQSETDWTLLSANGELIADDQLSMPFKVSVAAADGISVATEGMHVLAVQLLNGLTYLRVPFILARVAIESAANVVWMLSPASRAERIRRCLVLARLDLEDAHRLVKPAAVQQKDEALAAIDQVAGRANAGATQRLIVGTDSASSARVREAARVLNEESDCLLVWLVGSGFAHGRPYATDLMLNSVEVSVNKAVTSERVIGSVEGVLWAMASADMMLSRALQLYQERGAARPDAS